MDVSVLGTIDRKTYVKKFRRDLSPLSNPLDPPMYDMSLGRSTAYIYDIRLCWLLCTSVKRDIWCDGLHSDKPRLSISNLAPVSSRFEVEISGLWNFSVRVQSWSAKVETDPALIGKIFENHQSDPVLIRPYKTMYFILPHEAKQPREAK